MNGQIDTNYVKIVVFEPNELFTLPGKDTIDTEKSTPSIIDTSIHNLTDYWQLFDKDRHYIHALHGAYIPLSYEESMWLKNIPFQFEEIEAPSIVYKALTPFTRIDGLTGANSQEKLDFLHTQNVMYNWNVGLRYRFSKDASSYTSATSRKWLTQLYSHYESRDGKYYNHTDAQFRQGRHQENFGVDSVSLLQNVIPGADLLGVNNESAFHENRSMRLTLNHRYNINKADKLYGYDSLSSRFYLFQNVKYSWESHVFEDESFTINSELYPRFLGDSSTVFDSTKVRQFELPIGIGFRNKKINEEFFVKQYFYKYFSHDSVFNSVQRPYRQTSINNRLLLKLGKLELKSIGELTIGGINTGTYQISNTVLIPGRNQIKIEVDYYNLTQQIFWENFNNAYLQWNKVYEPEKQLKLAGEISNKLLSWRNEYRLILNRLFFDGEELSQNVGEIQFVKSTLDLKWNNKSWGFRTRNTVQYSSDSVISVPSFISKIWIYKKGYLFKKKMQIEIGLDGTYNTDYYSPYYSPFMGALIPQNQHLIKGYPLIGAYFAGKVKKTRFYLKGEHLNQGLSGFDYYSTLSYPLNGRTLKFGIIFDLFN